MIDRKKLRALTIGVLMGGTSAEREVSLRSGAAVCKGLVSKGYNALPIDAGDDLCAVVRRKKIDIAFIALHGGAGENGAVQGMLEAMRIPYTGSGILASALAMDKETSKKMFLYHRVPVPPFSLVYRSISGIRGAKRGKSRPSSKMGRLPAFPLPWVVKPATEGSSVGVAIVREKKDFGSAVEAAFTYGPRVIVEQFIAGQEVQIGILNDAILGGVEVRPSQEFYNYEAKYTAGLTQYIFPPRLGKRVYEKTKKIALHAHKALGCSGATRVDLIVDGSGSPWVLEVNTIPGMTETSLLPKIAQNAGLDFPTLLEEMVLQVRYEG
jgi:D-alanine-D-alanine ligase